MITWNAWDMRNFCVRHDYFTGGSNAQYSALLNYVDSHEPTERSVHMVAILIMTRTPRFDAICDYGTDAELDEAVTAMQNDIWNEVVKVLFEDENE